MRRSIWTGVSLTVLAAFLSGCPPLTPIRRAAFVPRPTVPADSGAPIGGKGVRVFGGVNSVDLSGGQGDISSIDDILSQIPEEGAAGVWIPTTQIGGGAYVAPNEWVEFGGQLHYTSLKWAHANVLGVPEFPPGHQEEPMWMGGPGVRINVPVGDGFITPAFLAEANVVSVPQAVYVCSQCNGTYNIDQPPVYTFERMDRKSFLLPTWAAHLTISPIEYVHIIGLVAAERGVKNVGFDPDINNLENDTLDGYWYGTAGGGVELRYKFVYATALFTGAFGQPQEIGFGPSLTAQIGMVYHWGKPAEDAPPPDQAAPPVR